MIGGLNKTASTLALAAAAGLMIGGMVVPTTARAADLGGDCCADLEARVAELEATTARKGNKVVSLTISGRVAVGMTYWTEDAPAPDDDNVETYLDHSSDRYFGSQVGDGPNLVLKGEGKLRQDVVAGFFIEMGINALDGGTHAISATER